MFAYGCAPVAGSTTAAAEAGRYHRSMEFDTIAVRADGDRGELVLDQPEKLNPLSTTTLGSR
jgi:hypothetical protein